MRVEAAQAPGMDVGLDFHGRVHRPLAKQLAKALEPLGPLFIEEPLLSEHPEACARSRTHAPARRSRWVSGSTALGLQAVLRSRAPSTSSSPTSATRAASSSAQDRGDGRGVRRGRGPHCPLGPLALAACLQLAACAPNAVIQEMSLGIHYNAAHDLLNFCTNKEQLTPTTASCDPDRSGPGHRYRPGCRARGAQGPPSLAQPDLAPGGRQLCGVVIAHCCIAAAAPSAEALALGRQIAEAGALASFVELVQAKEDR